MSFFSEKTSGKLTWRGPQLLLVVLKSVMERKGFEQGRAKPIILNWAERGHLVPLHLNLQHTWFKPPRTPGHCLLSAQGPQPSWQASQNTSWMHWASGWKRTGAASGNGKHWGLLVGIFSLPSRELLHHMDTPMVEHMCTHTYTRSREKTQTFYQSKEKICNFKKIKNIVKAKVQHICHWSQWGCFNPRYKGTRQR